MTGHIHSIESFGTVDGPGIRLVVFTKGCPMRCLYCHNPDTWASDGGQDMAVDDIIRQYNSSRHFYQGGGLTVSGGEPLMQIEFVTQLFEAAKKENIHTCLDTSGITFCADSPRACFKNHSRHLHAPLRGIFDPDSVSVAHYASFIGAKSSTKCDAQLSESIFQTRPNVMEQIDRLLDSTDLILLDIKHIDPKEHQLLCGQPNSSILEFARYLDLRHIPVWIRHVVVPGITDHAESLFQLGEFIGTLKNVKALDVLPYHDMGKTKYKELGIEYPLKDTPPLSKENAIKARKIILRGIKAERKREIQGIAPDLEQ